MPPVEKRADHTPAILLLPVFGIAVFILCVGQCAKFLRPSDEDYRRYAILEDAHRRVAGFEFVGKPVADVIAVYGEPSNSDKFNDWDRRWVLCPNGLDFCWLLVNVDAGGRVTKAAVMSD